MRFRAIETTWRTATNTLINQLRGRMFHVTSPANFVKICASGAILSNTSGNFKHNWGNNYYFKNKGCLSVVDLVNNTRPRITKRKMLNDYSVFEQASPVVVFLFLSPAIHHRAITWHSWKKEKAHKQQVVPELESGIPESIPLSDIEEIWFITLKDRTALYEQITKTYIQRMKSISSE